jgi:hypothetical protein
MSDIGEPARRHIGVPRYDPAEVPDWPQPQDPVQPLTPETPAPLVEPQPLVPA